VVDGLVASHCEKEWGSDEMSRESGFISRKRLRRAETRNKQWTGHYEVGFLRRLKQWGLCCHAGSG
jgi:hypothetical protein